MRAALAPLAACLGTALVAVAAWLLYPRPDPHAQPALPALHAVLVDASASVRRTRPAWSAWARRLLAHCADEAEAAHAELLVVEFAADVRASFGPGAPLDYRARLTGSSADGLGQFERLGQGLREEGSQLARALEVAGRALGEDRPAGRLVLITDGRATGADPRPALAALRGAGVDVQRIALPAPELPDLAVTALAAPASAEAGAPLAASVEIAVPALADLAGTLELTLEVELARAGDPPWAASFPVPPGASDMRIPLPARARGVHRLTVRGRARDRATGRLLDPLPENDTASVWIEVGEPLVCVVLASPEDERADRLVAEGLEFIRSTPDRLPLDLARADVLLTIDVGPAELPADALERFVRSGGGWLALAGWGFLRGWQLPGQGEAHGDQAVSALLPLRPHPGDAGPREVVLLVDGSGSMRGQPFERVREAALEMALGALPSDRLSLRFFTGALGPVVFSSSGGSLADRRLALEPLLAASVPRGPTDVLYSLDELATERESSVTPGLVILISDGRTNVWQAAQSRAVRDRLRATDTRLRVLAVGERSDQEFLGSLLAPGEELVDAGDLSDLARLLHRELNEKRVREGDLLALLVEATALPPDSPARRIVEAWRPQGPEANDAWKLERYVRAQTAPLALALWTSDEDEPLLALHRVGAGLVAACATTHAADWAPFLAQRSELLFPILRTLGRETREPAIRMFAQEERLIVEPVPESWPAIVDARFRAGGAPRLGMTDEGVLGTLELRAPDPGFAPGARSTRTALKPAFLATCSAGTPLRVELLGEGRRLAELPFAVPLPEELAGRTSRASLPADLDTGLPMKSVSDSAELRAGRRPGRFALPALLLGLLLLAFSAWPNQGNGTTGRN